MKSVLEPILSFVTEDARYRLNHDWVAHKHKMYVFRDRLVTIDQAKEMCKFEWAPMVKIESDEEEQFIEDYIRERDSHYWLSLRWKTGNEYYWDSDGTDLPPGTGYWMDGSTPWGSDSEACVHVKMKCDTPLRCWEKGDCGIKRRTFCKVKANPRWLT
nr:PREDICTED: L-selectin isoform X1 [Anolis carolinensis]|eukprot:XP_016853268.1 PREDICTED: L-selectin isoform X1 [Anolis carolinensis]